MTKEEILSADPETLRLWVAEQLMEYRWHYGMMRDGRALMLPADEYDPERHSHWPLEKCNDLSVPPYKDALRFVPKFSTEIGAAWPVFEWLRELYSLVVIHAANGYGCTAFTVNDGGKIVRAVLGPANAPTAAEAICRTALLASLEWCWADEASVVRDRASQEG